MENQEKWEWIYIDGVKTNYKISNIGNVKSFLESNNGKDIKRVVNYSNAYQVCLRVDNEDGNGRRSMTRTVHVIVGQTFLKSEEGLKEVVAIDGDYLNTHISNLKWAKIRKRPRKKKAIMQTNFVEK